MSDQHGTRSYHLQVWRQARGASSGRMASYEVTGIDQNMSFLEMFDQLNETLLRKGEDPVAIDSDCREGICGTCGVCMREFPDGSTIVVEPFRADAFPVVKDLIVDRSAFDRIVMKGGYISINAGSAPEANAAPVPKDAADAAMDSAACIGCGACVAACPNAAAALFTSARVRYLSLLPQGQPERTTRVMGMVEQMDAEGFGHCSNHGECEAACPKSISIENIAKMRREYLRASLRAG